MTMGARSVFAVLAALAIAACEKGPGADESDATSFGQGASPDLKHPATKNTHGSPSSSSHSRTKHAVVTGKDVYRLNCQGCHGPNGAGSQHMPGLTKFAKDLAAGKGEKGLRQRLSEGGQRMPAFPNFTDAEVAALLDYLRELGGGTATSTTKVGALSGAALGERIHQSNCASCHEPSRAANFGMMCQPASLAGLDERFSKQQVMSLLKVGVGPMPAFPHLTAQELDALWGYLSGLPAEPSAQPTMGEMCPMVRAAMEGQPASATMHGRRATMGRQMFDAGTMLWRRMGCMMKRPAPGGSGAPGGPAVVRRMPPCCW